MTAPRRKTVAILGASADRRKFGNKSVRAHQAAGWKVYPINPHGGFIEGLPVYQTLADLPTPVDRVSLYLPPPLGLRLLPEIAAANPTEFFVNPGAGNAELLAEARRLGLNPIPACSIVALGLPPDRLKEALREDPASPADTPHPGLEPLDCPPAKPVAEATGPGHPQTPPPLDYPQRPTLPGWSRHTLLTDEEPLPPHRTFAKDYRDAFAYPFWSIGNAFTFCVVAAVAVWLYPRSLYAGFSPMLYAKPLAYGVIAGWLWGFYFSVVTATTKDSDDLPDLLPDPLISTALHSLVRYLGAAAVAFLPAALNFLLCRGEILPPAAETLLPLWIALGAFLLPISLLLFAFEMPAAFYRPDRILRTIWRTFLPYVAIWPVVLAHALAQIIAYFPSGQAWLGWTAADPPWCWLGETGCRLSATYLALVAMRVIGLYYLHHRHRFAVVAE